MLKPEEIEAKLKEFSSTIDLQKKTFETQITTMKSDFELKLESAQREVESWKANAQKREEEIKKFQEQAEKSKKEAEAAIAKSREQEIKGFAESLKREGRITPAQEEIVIKLMESMTSDANIHSFKEKDGSTRQHTQLSLFKLLISSLKKSVSYSEESYGVPPAASVPDANADEELPTQRVFSKQGGWQNLQVQGLNVADAAEKYMEEQRGKGKFVTYEQALIAVSPRKQVQA